VHVVNFTVSREAWDTHDGDSLRRQQRAELDARYGSDDHEPGTPPTAEDITVFLVARDAAGDAVAEPIELFEPLHRATHP
jgi:putative acetyltransferase